MNRTLLIIIVLYLVWRVLHAYGRRADRRARGADDFSRFSAKRKGRVSDGGSSMVAGGDLVACSRCGVLIPQARAGVDEPPLCSECRDAEGGR